MKNTSRYLLLAATAILVVCISIPKLSSTGAVAHAQSDPGNACTDQTVVGTYGFNGQGVLGFGTAQAIQAAETGMATADGFGNLAGSVTFSLNGNILRTPFTGTYQVNPNCSISETITFGSQVRHQEGVIVLNGREIDFIATDPGSLVTRVAKRVSPLAVNQ
jgi:hypothetical protein